MTFALSNLEEDFVAVCGMMRGFSKKEGNNFNRPYVMVHVLKALPGEDSLGYGVDSLFFWTDEKDVIFENGIEIGDKICPIYVGTGDFKKLKKIEVIKSTFTTSKEKK